MSGDVVLAACPAAGVLWGLLATLQDWLPQEHLAYFISDMVDQLDIPEISTRYERGSWGGSYWNPGMMVKARFCGYCVGVASSRPFARTSGDASVAVS